MLGKNRDYSTSTCRFDIAAYSWLYICNSEDIMFFTLNWHVTRNKQQKWGPVNVTSLRDVFHLYCDQSFPRKGSLRVWNITIISAFREQKSFKVLRSIFSENNTRNILSLLVKNAETEYSCHSNILKIPVLTRLRSSLRALPCKGVFLFNELAEMLFRDLEVWSLVQIQGIVCPSRSIRRMVGCVRIICSKFQCFVVFWMSDCVRKMSLAKFMQHRCN
jgi:hypothetical protein